MAFSLKTVMLSGAALSMLGTSAFAADIAPAPVADWTGFYIGAQAGGVFGLSADYPDGCNNWGKYDVDFDPITPLNPPGGGSNTQPVHVYTDSEIDGAYCDSDTSGDESAFAGGIRGGYDFQHDALVFGVLGDYNWTNVEQSSFLEFDLDKGASNGTQTGQYDLPGNLWNFDAITTGGGVAISETGTPLQTLEYETALEGFGTARARLGMAVGAEQRFMLFGTGGLAFGNVSSKWSQTAEYTPDETDRVFDTPSGTFGGGDPYPNDDNDGEFFPRSETATLPSNCEATGEYPGSQTGGPGTGQTGVVCSDSGSDSEFQVGFAVGGGAEYLLTDNVSIGGEFMYINLGDVSGPGGDLDFWSGMATVSFRFN